MRENYSNFHVLSVEHPFPFMGHVIVVENLWHCSLIKNLISQIVLEFVPGLGASIPGLKMEMISGVAICERNSDLFAYRRLNIGLERKRGNHSRVFFSAVPHLRSG